VSGREAAAGSPLSSLGPADVLRAAELIRIGKVYDLDCGRWPGMPVWEGHADLQVLTYRSPQGVRNQRDHEYWMGRNDVKYGWHSALIVGSQHSGTHIDALCHVTCGSDDHWFGGRTSGEHLGDFGPLADDAADIPPIAGRGVLIDVAAEMGVGALEARYEIGADDLRRALQKQGTELAPGDTVLIRTGYMSVWPDPEGMAAHRTPGINVEAAEFLMDAGAVTVGADTEALECLPSRVEGNPQPVHIAMLVERGVYIIEMAYLEDLARDEAYEFFFVCTALKIKGATGSMVRPIAIA
jgi:kynurenine formamidase